MRPRPPRELRVAARHRGRRHDLHGLPAADRQVRRRHPRGARRRPGRDARGRGKTQTTYGVIWIKANTAIDKDSRLVQLDDIQIVKANFPTAGDKADEYLEVFREPHRGHADDLARPDRGEPGDHAGRTRRATPRSRSRTTRRRSTTASTPAVLVLIDGEPVLRPVEGSPGIERVINTRSLILKTGGGFYMPIADRWLTASLADRTVAARVVGAPRRSRRSATRSRRTRSRRRST